MSNYANVNLFGNPLAPGWQAQNLMDVAAPNGQHWTVNRQAAQAFQGFLTDLVKAGYNPLSSGGFNYRNIRGSNTLSQHAFGNAIDIGADANPMLAPGSKVVTNLPSNVNELANKWGLEWGGNWQRPDAMHFEWKGPQDGSAPAPAATLAGLYSGGAAPAAAPAQGTAPVVASAAPAPGAMPPDVAAAMGGLPARIAALQQPVVAPTSLADLFVAQSAKNQALAAQQQAAADEAQARRRALIGGAPDPFTHAVMS